jgi:plasmid stabilization system protein ParE
LFVKRLRKYASDRLRDFPESGAVVEEYNDPSVRDIYFKDQRIIFRYDGVTVTILNVVHGSHVLRPPKPSGD